MKNIFAIFLAYSICMSSGLVAQSITSPKQLRKTDLDVVNEFLSEIPSDASWSEWLAENGPIYGNYCDLATGTRNFDTQCLNRLDCICKARDFGMTLMKHREADLEFVKKSLGDGVNLRKEDKNEKILLQLMTIKLFAASVVGVNISEGMKIAYNRYGKDRQSGLAMLREIIDENEVFRKKIEEVNIERLRFEDQKIESESGQDYKTKSMAISVQPFNLIFGLFLLNYETRISPILSLRLGASVYATGLITDTYLGYGNNNKDFSTFFAVGLKCFFTGESLASGLYIEPNLEVGYENVARVSDPAIRDRDVALVPAVSFGMEKVFASGFQLDLGIGGGFHIGIPVSTDVFSTYFIVPKIRAAVGYAW